MKLIAVDVDGTLLNSDGVITEKTRDALIAAGNAGHKVVIVSGRPTAAVYHLAKELKFDEFGGLLSNFNGGSITNYATGEVISSHSLDIDLAKELLALTNEMDIEFVIPKGDMIISNKDSKYLGVEKSILGLETDVIEDLVDSLDFAPNKIVFANDPELLEEQMPIFRERFADRTSQVRSQRFYYEIMPVGLSKGASLLEIADHYGIDRADIIAFGDEMNDYTMIEVAGVGVAMANAVEPIKEIADYTTLSNDKDGIAAYLEEFVL